MKVDFTYDIIEMEPGPNLYLMGNNIEYQLLSETFASLSTNIDFEISLRSIYKNLEIVDNMPLNIIFKSLENGNILSKVEKNNITVELSPALWLAVLKITHPLSYKKAHAFIEFDNLALREDCNIIISSEW